jgi:hypothetical protein
MNLGEYAKSKGYTMNPYTGEYSTNPVAPIRSTRPGGPTPRVVGGMYSAGEILSGAERSFNPSVMRRPQPQPPRTVFGPLGR